MEDDTRTLNLTVRYAREQTDSGTLNREENLGHGELRWAIPPAQAALLLVDYWADYSLVSGDTAGP